LIGGLLQPIYSGIRGILFDPFEFMRNPVSWLQVISRYRATVSGAPSFAYDMCCRNVRSSDCNDLCLESWTIAIVGAEPIQHGTLSRFAAQYAGNGFSRESFFTSYGLAESTLVVTGGPREREPNSVRLERRALESGRIERTENTDEAVSRVLVSCGPALLDQEVRIVDPETCIACSELEIGEVWIAGPSVAQGYWNQNDDSKSEFEAELAGAADGKVYLRSGDMGFLLDGELYLTGRIKDLIIVNGRNLYPDDIERLASDAHVALRNGKGAAFSVEIHGSEQYVVAHEIEFGGKQDAAEVLEEMRQAVVASTGIAPGAVVLVRSGGIPRTSSGKIRRQACRQSYLADELPIEGAWHNPALEAG
jgi:acyl-CoA synthetase (AMP-forming)/AMP-acid ligase II